MRRPSALKAIIGHLKKKHRTERDDLAVRHHDATNAAVAAVAQSDLPPTTTY
jgi:hypothetical protein